MRRFVSRTSGCLRIGLGRATSWQKVRTSIAFVPSWKRVAVNGKQGSTAMSCYYHAGCRWLKLPVSSVNMGMSLRQRRLPMCAPRGSALSAGSLATSAFVATHFAAATAVIGWVTAEWLRNGKPSALGAISGAVAGLVAITPAAGFVTPMAALAIGAIAGVFCYLMVAHVKARFGYDDSLDAFGVHGAGGTVGALLTGVFATSARTPSATAARSVARPGPGSASARAGSSPSRR